jgi:hypothetical protein
VLRLHDEGRWVSTRERRGHFPIQWPVGAEAVIKKQHRHVIDIDAESWRHRTSMQHSSRPIGQKRLGD